MAPRPVKPRALDRLKADPTLLDTLKPEGERPAAAPRKGPRDSQYRSTFIVGREVHERLREVAAREELPPSDIVRFVLRRFLEDYEREGPLTREMRGRVYAPPAGRKLR